MAIHRSLNEAVQRVRIAAAPDRLLRVGSAIARLIGATGLVQQLGVDKVVKHSAHGGIVVVREATEQLDARHRSGLLDVRQDGFPETPPLIRLTGGEPRNLRVIGTQGHAEHVCDHLVTYTLVVQLANEVGEHLIGDT